MNGSGQGLELMVYINDRKKYFSDEPKAVPIAAVPHRIFPKRAMDAPVRSRLPRRRPLLEAADLVTDDSSFAQWYVGNYSTPDALQFDLYVDDVSIVRA